MSRATCVVVLAAGEGTRMRSARPKPLHQICGRPMTQYVLDAVGHVRTEGTIVVVGHAATWVQKELGDLAPPSARLTFVEQGEQLGTGHAVLTALGTINEMLGSRDGDVVIVPGDTPLLRSATLNRLIVEHVNSQAALTVVTARVEDPSGYGRIVRARDGSVARIVEQRDATPAERAIAEINTSIMVVRASLLGPALRRVGRRNDQNEYYLTDLVGVLFEAGHVTRALELEDPLEAAGVNDRAQLAVAETRMRQRINQRWMQRGVTMWDPAATYVDADVVLASEVVLLPGTVLKGHSVIERGAQVGPHATLQDVAVGENARVGSIEATNVVIGPDARVASFAVLAPGTRVPSAGVVKPFEHRHP